MSCDRRTLLKLGLGATVFGAFRGTQAVAQQGPNGVLWVQLFAGGGWDQMLFTEPKQGLRNYGSTPIAQAGNIPYVAFPEVAPFFEAHHQRLLVMNGIDTTTNNHDVGVRYSMSGSLLEGFPIFAAQVAGALGPGTVLPMFNVWGYDEGGGLVAPTRLDYIGIPNIESLKTVARPPSVYRNDTVSDRNVPFLPAATQTRLMAAHNARTTRLLAARKLPRHQAGLHALEVARNAAENTTGLDLSPLTPPAPEPYGSTKTLITRGVGAFKSGLAVSINVGFEGFDTHGEGDDAHRELLGRIFDLATWTVNAADVAEVPVIVVMSSDFGRTPSREGNGQGTGHWPVSTLMVLQNQRAFALGRLPGDLVIGGTTGEVASANPDPARVLQARTIDPATLQLSASGVKPNPSHVYRALRRAAGIDGHAALRSHPIAIDGADLALG